VVALPPGALEAAARAIHREASGYCDPGCDGPYPLDERQARAALEAAAPLIAAAERQRIRQLAAEKEAQYLIDRGDHADFAAFADLLEDPPPGGPG